MSINCIVVTPAETAVETEASSITLPLFDGDKGVMADHAPMIGRLGNGELKLEGPEGGSRFYIEGGFVQVLDNTVSILTNRVVAVEDLDSSALAEELSDTLAMPGNNDEELDLRERASDAVRAQLRVAQRS
ncbi:MAG: F0F1 ATP synthase subunit epsilon [Pirellulales bacterium]|jgi:F-type H+-transporting ATPase subunit epsilon|nr:F0F1 ATP synthase subunit epsilon [Rhodopirellula sp.]MCH2370152.1 F0F1 ATP synthase subunit epsilon [Pirellulales bacterium]|tara:strand:+ start:107 stop:499 length:393 start_codon:yes stop_codon:yes gene_type:complete